MTSLQHHIVMGVWFCCLSISSDCLVFLLLFTSPNPQKALESFVLCTLSLIIRIFTIIYNVLQHYYDKQCSSETLSSLLTSLLAENNGGACALGQSVKKYNERLF